ncbi:MAG TPA: hypothetical protein VFI91_06215 [Longimicrobiaceae bacterium]|nr:hypothetical protein [Longimicrobiaceae bacterium]
MKTATRSALAFALALSVTACADEPVDDAELVEDPVVEPMADVDIAEPAMQDEVNVADIVADPAMFAGRTVTVIADVEEVYGPKAFALDEDDALEGGIDNDLMVIGDDVAGLTEIDDQWLDNQVQVTGTVQTWTIVDMEREVGWDLDPALEAEVEERGAVLIASSVERVET